MTSPLGSALTATMGCDDRLALDVVEMLDLLFVLLLEGRAAVSKVNSPRGREACSLWSLV